MISSNENKRKGTKPAWLKSRLPSADVYSEIKSALDAGCLHTICESGKCPNIGECWAAGAATFMILGNSCTRNCRFCAVDHARPALPDAGEPAKLAATVVYFKLKHCVITSVTRDDLADEGARHWASCILEVRSKNPSTSIEVLVPDFHAREDLLKIVFDAKPEIFSHNIETVERLTPQIRSGAQYQRSLEVLKLAYKAGMNVKSGIMTGLGERMEEIEQTLRDIRATGCSILTVGQYLQPRHENHPVEKYYTPEEFDYIKKFALGLGFRHVESGPLVRSSYHAADACNNI